jgi:hypothetical protein
MVFSLLAKLFSIISSAVVYIVATVVFSKNKETMVAFGLALIAITIILFLARLLFFKGEHRLKFAMKSMQPRGFMMRRMARSYKHTHDRQVISGGVARILAFGTIFYLLNHNLLIVYGLAGFAIVTGLIMMASFRNKFIDLITGAILGIGAGFFSMQFASLIMKMIGI